MPKVSVITAAYNHVQFVRQSVESVQAQTFRDFEHIVVDDGSSDGTAEILKSFGNKITYIRQENRGAHAAINVGIRASSGEYVAILDSDDMWLPTKLERQISVFKENPDAGMVYSFAYTIDGRGNVRNNGETYGKPLEDSKHAFRELVLLDSIPVLTVLVRKDCMERVGLFDETLKAISDWDLWLRISVYCSIVCVPEPLALYRVHEKNTWDVVWQTGRVHEDWVRMLDKFAHEHPGLLPNIDTLRANVLNTYVDRLLDYAYGRYYRQQYEESRRYLLKTLIIRPSWLIKDRSIRLAAKLILGERATKFIQRVKNR